MPGQNTLCHFEIPSTDFVRSKAFYEGLFGWQVEIMPSMDFAAFSNEHGLSGCFAFLADTCGAQVGIWSRE